MSITFNGKLVPKQSISIRAQKLLKGIFDRCGAVVGLILTAPIFLVVSIMLKLQRDDVFFLQDRIGLDLETFRIFKFTTMVRGSEKRGSITASNDARITALGHFLRRFKLNEMPQLINVLKGEMSFVGPRPLPRSEVEEYYSLKDRVKIYSVKPGITGRGSMEFSNEEERLSESNDFEECFAKEIMPKKAKLEVWYVDNWNITLDTKLFFGTVFKLLKTFAGYPINRFIRRKQWPGRAKTY